MCYHLHPWLFFISLAEYFAQCVTIENRQGKAHVVKLHFSKPHFQELSNEILYTPPPQGVSKIQQVKVQKSTFVK